VGRFLVLGAFVVALALPVAVYAFAGPEGPKADAKLFATVGPGFTISLKNAAGADVTQLNPGTYEIEIEDRSADHNFKISGPGGVSAGTTVSFVGTRTVTVTLVAGEYTYVCEVHYYDYDMIGRFTVGSGSSTPTPTSPTTKLVGTVGPGSTISLKKAGIRVTSLKAGLYSIAVNDRASIHNFHLFGPGVNKATGVAFVGKQTWRVRLKPGLYTYRCDVHRTTLRRTFRVRA
jgi:plastocyanin